MTGHAVLADSEIDTMAQISAMTIAEVGGATFLVTASTAQNGISVRSIAGDGSLGAPTTMGTGDGLWISAPSVLASAKLGGATYLILGAAGSQSLSVIEGLEVNDFSQEKIKATEAELAEEKSMVSDLLP